VDDPVRFILWFALGIVIVLMAGTVAWNASLIYHQTWCWFGRRKNKVVELWKRR